MASPNAFATAMSTPIGRGARIVLGLLLIIIGWTNRGDITGVVLMLVGVVPILAGGLNVCLIAPLIGAPFSGRAARHDDSAPI